MLKDCCFAQNELASHGRRTKPILPSSNASTLISTVSFDIRAEPFGEVGTNNCNSSNVEFLRAAKVLLLRRDNPLARRMAASSTKESYTELGLTPPNVSQNVTFTSEMLADIDRFGRRTRSCYRHVAQALQRCGVDVMELSYEQLNLNHRSFVRVLSFLGEKAEYSDTEKLLQGTDSRWHCPLSDSGKHHVNGPVAYLNLETTRLFGSMLEEGRFEYLRYCHLFDNCTLEPESHRRH